MSVMTSGPRRLGPGNLSAFVESTGADRRDTAIILIGAAREAGLDDTRHVKSTTGGFYISDELADVLYDEDETDESVDDEEVSGNESDEDEEPETEEPTEAPKTRSKRGKKASGDRAAKNDSTEEE